MAVMIERIEPVWPIKRDAQNAVAWAIEFQPLIALIAV